MLAAGERTRKLFSDFKELFQECKKKVDALYGEELDRLLQNV